MQIAENLVALIHYTLKNEEGQVLDSSEGQEPLPFLCGANNIVAGLEKALLGKTVGDKLDVTVQPEEGYGEIRAELIQKVDRENFQGIDDIQVGMQFMAEAPWGQQPVTVVALEEDGVMLDGNHPLAGQVLIFSVEVTDVREATENEIAHGHVHESDEGDCCNDPNCDSKA
ncbi:FKBP-type peptidyl-prolyl cis-trans isomerase [Neptuniibacter caesariensis]|uniref:Peptidyl-prolyl cis-trans isomerase n=1 Tax=Neptuniibacter caesariensis TaxID=207954 RepID=A0A7U8C4W2_NEPCE|nr:peptidylprolyl isomerase [Neptuniibacter caesariensis]EAR60155.1 Peptidylprolyl isomerase, FKBP-type [Oceanospirillum sp. MED92] [Neptuniibacter caesariensis]